MCTRVSSGEVTSFPSCSSVPGSWTHRHFVSSGVATWVRASLSLPASPSPLAGCIRQLPRRAALSSRMHPAHDGLDPDRLTRLDVFTCRCGSGSGSGSGSVRSPSAQASTPSYASCSIRASAMPPAAPTTPTWRDSCSDSLRARARSQRQGCSTSPPMTESRRRVSPARAS